MSNYLVLTSEYVGVVGASGVCTKNIVDKLKDYGHCVSVLCYGADAHEENVYAISCPRKDGKVSLLQKMSAYIASLFFPITDKQIEKRFIETAKILCRQKNIDSVICVYFPLETVAVFKDIRKTYPAIQIISYELDSVGDGIFSASKAHTFSRMNYECWMNRNYRYVDRVIVMKSHEAYWKKVFGERHGDKLLVADIPVLLNHIVSTKKEDADGAITAIYAGLLGRKYRSPKHLLAVFYAVSKKMNLVLDMYSRGDCEGMIADYAQKNSFIRQHGYVEAETVEAKTQSADIFVSIGNRISNSIPSKLINYFAYGKPVVHFAAHRGDVCIGYVNKYPLGLVIYEDDSVDENSDKVLQFISETRGKAVDFSYIAKEFSMNRPEYSANLIENTEIYTDCLMGC